MQLKVYHQGGIPAEEIYIGKPFMARAGLLNDIDVMFYRHSGAQSTTGYATSDAYCNNQYHFHGKTAHGSAPWSVRRALDEALIMIEHLREHMSPGSAHFSSETINYSFPDVGPSFPNIVPDRASLLVIGRFVTSETPVLSS